MSLEQVLAKRKEENKARPVAQEQWSWEVCWGCNGLLDVVGVFIWFDSGFRKCVLSSCLFSKGLKDLYFCTLWGLKCWFWDLKHLDVYKGGTAKWSMEGVQKESCCRYFRSPISGAQVEVCVQERSRKAKPWAAGAETLMKRKYLVPL